MRALTKKSALVLILLGTFSVSSLTGQGRNKDEAIEIDIEKLPEIQSLSPRRENVVFQQFNEIVEKNSRRAFAGESPEYTFFRYKAGSDSVKFDFLQLCARLNINIDTMATLNSIASKDDSIKGQTIIVPTVQGLFIPLDGGKNDIETLLFQNYKNQNLTKGTLYYKIKGRNFVFIQGKRFEPTERAFYLDSAFMLPLTKDSFTVSSEFGKRKNPFSGQMKDHNGIDLAAAEGSPVYAIKDGDVAYVVPDDPVFGNYIILSHDHGKQTSVYAHLSKVNVDQYQSVKKGTIIGLVGHTGMATGDHLHFEIRQGGKVQNPRDKLNF